MHSSTNDGNNAQVVYKNVTDLVKLGFVIETEDAKVASISSDEAGQQARKSGVRLGMIVEEIDGEPFDRHTLVNKREAKHQFALKLIKAGGPPLGAGLAKSVKIPPGERLPSSLSSASIIGAWYGKLGDEWKPWKKNGTDVTKIVKQKLESGEEVCAQGAALGITDSYRDQKTLVVLVEAASPIVNPDFKEAKLKSAAEGGTVEAEQTPTIRANDDYRWCWAKSGLVGASAYFNDPLRWSKWQNTEATIKDLKTHQQESTPVYLECQRDQCNCVWVFDTCEHARSVVEVLRSEAEKRKDDIQSCRQHLARNKLKLHAGKQLLNAIALRASRNVTVRAILERIKSAVDEAGGIPEFPRDILEDAARHGVMWEKYKAISLGLEPTLLAELNVSLEELKDRARKEGVEDALDGLQHKEAVLQRILVKKAEATLPDGWKVKPSQGQGSYDIVFLNDSQASWTHPQYQDDLLDIDKKDLAQTESNLGKFNTCMKASAEEFAAMIEFLEESIVPVGPAEVSDLVKRVEAEQTEAKEERLKTREELIREKMKTSTIAPVAATSGTQAVSQTNVEASPIEPDSQTEASVAATLGTQSGSQTNVEVAATPGTEGESETNAPVAATRGTQAVSQTNVPESTSVCRLPEKSCPTGLPTCCLLAVLTVVVLYAAFFIFGTIRCDCGLTALEGLPGLDLSHWATTTIEDQGTQRCWFTYKPPSVSDEAGSVPVVIDLHGNQACGYVPVFNTGFRQKAEEEGIIVVYPQGAQNLPSSSNVGNRMASWSSYPKNNRTSFIIGATRAGIDDVAFLNKMIDHLLATHSNADPKRIYVTGHSNGCYMAQRFAAEASNRIAAMGCFAGHLVTPIPVDYSPVPIMVVHGTADTLAKYGAGWSFTELLFGFELPTAMQNIQRWAAANNCSSVESVTSSEDFFETAYQEGCSKGASATLVSLTGIGHFPFHEQYKTKIPWNSLSHFIAQMNIGSYPFSRTVDSTSVVYEFMKRHHAGRCDRVKRPSWKSWFSFGS